MPSTLTAGTLRFVRHCTRFPGPLWYLALDAGQRRDHSALAVLYLSWTAQGLCPTTYEHLVQPHLEIRFLKRFPIGLVCDSFPGRADAQDSEVLGVSSKPRFLAVATRPSMRRC